MPQPPALARRALEEIFAALLAAHGPQHWWPAETPFEVMVGAVLIQRTAWRNAEQALARLRAAGALEPEMLAGSDAATLQEWIRPAGFYRQKAVRLQAISAWLLACGGIAGAARLDDAALRGALLAVHGIGEETADVICLYAFGRAHFVVDAYARRLFARLGLIDGSEPYGVLRAVFEDALAADAAWYNECHALIVAHGKAFCRSRPHCAQCGLRPRCAHGAAIDLPLRHG